MLTSLAKLSVGVFSLGVQRLTWKTITNQLSFLELKGGNFGLLDFAYSQSYEDADYILDK